jgi:excisionase family DNA binding protein
MIERLAYTVPEACEALRVGRTKLYELLADKKIEAVALDGRTLILRDKIERFLAGLPPIPLKARSGLKAREPMRVQDGVGTDKRSTSTTGGVPKLRSRKTTRNEKSVSAFAETPPGR